MMVVAVAHRRLQRPPPRRSTSSFILHVYPIVAFSVCRSLFVGGLLCCEDWVSVLLLILL